MTEQETFNEWVKQLEPSMAVPLYPKALLLDFMKKSFFAGLKQHEHDYLVKTNDLKANFDYILEGKDLEIKTLGERCNQLLKDKGELTDKIADIKANCDLAIEGRDVKIKELEKENARLTTNEKSLLAERKIIVKENAELKEYNKYLRRKRQGGIQKQYNKVAIIKQQADQLTKAKEIIKDLLEHNKEHWLYSDIKKQAEQFLKEIEK